MDKITLRLKPGQMQVIEELREALGANTATIIRAIISDFLVRNEDILERIIVDYQKTGKPLSETNQILNFQEDDESTRLNRISMAHTAQKASNAYKGAGLQEKMATVMQIGMTVLMILAMVL